MMESEAIHKMRTPEIKTPGKVHEYFWNVVAVLGFTLVLVPVLTFTEIRDWAKKELGERGY